MTINNKIWLSELLLDYNKGVARENVKYKYKGEYIYIR